LASLFRRKVTPTSMTTAEIQKLGASWTRNSFFSAQTLEEDLLDGYKADIARMLAPEVVRRADRITPENPEGFVTEGLNLAKAREQAQVLLDKIGYQPNPGEEGTLLDLSSDQRIDLVLETNKQIAQGEAWWLQGQDETILDAYPAQELYRAVDPAGGDRAKRPWLQRFRLAGQATGDPIGTGWTITPEGKMIALKNHAIWDRLGDPDLFPDGLGNPFPPFAFHSGMDLRDVSRRATQDLGLITANETVQPKSVRDLVEVAA
jgi:hypothetical protein